MFSYSRPRAYTKVNMNIVMMKHVFNMFFCISDEFVSESLENLENYFSLLMVVGEL